MEEDQSLDKETGGFMDDLIYAFLDYIRVERNYSDYTDTNYELDLNNYESYLKSKRKNYLNIKYKDVMEYISYLKEECNLESTSINRHLSAIRSFYNYLIREGKIESNPFKLIKGPKNAKKLPNYMKYSEFEELVNTCDDTPLGIRNRALFELLLASGARIGELIKIEVDDIDFINQEIKVLGKGNKERIIYFNDYAKDALKKYINEARNELLNGNLSDRLFINHIGGDLTTRGVRDIIDKMIQKSSLNIKCTPHTFRHTFATMLLNEGCDLKSVQELLGHANLSTTSIYTHITSDRIKDIYLKTHPRERR